MTSRSSMSPYCGSSLLDFFGGSDYYEFLAPSVYHLQTSFQKRIKETGLDDTATLYDVEDLKQSTFGIIRSKGSEVICPIDGKRGAAYVHCINGEDHVGTATYILSYDGCSRYLDIIETLVAFCKEKELDPKRTYIWIYCLCNNYHRVAEEKVPFEDFKRIFNKRVMGIKNVLAMMTPWTRPAYLTRVWCIIEMYSANEYDGCTLQIVIPPKEKNNLVNALLKSNDDAGKDGLHDPLQDLVNTKVELANAYRSQDKENILKLVDQKPGYYVLNAAINQLIRTWVRDSVIDAARTAIVKGCDDNTQRRNVAVGLALYGSFFSKNGVHKEALELHQKSLIIYKSINADTEDIAKCYSNIGIEHESLGDYEKAIKSHTSCLEIYNIMFGTSHILSDKEVKGKNQTDIVASYTNIGRIMQQNKNLDGAYDMFKTTLIICAATYGKDHLKTGICYGNIGLIYYMRGDYDTSIEMHEKMKENQESVLGKLHPDTAQVYQDIGAAYYKKNYFEISLEMLTKAKTLFEESLGTDHPKSKNASDWVSLVEESQHV